MTAHGIPNIARSESTLIRVIWLISVLASFSYCCYGLSKNLQNYLNNESVTETSFDRVVSLEFPTITICNLMQYKTNDPTFPYREKFQSVENITRDLINATVDVSYLFANQMAQFVVNQKGKNNADKVSYTVDDMLLNCQFNFIFCDKSDFHQWYSTVYGLCFSFNSGLDSKGNKIELKKSLSPGRQNALRLDLFVDTPENKISFIRSSGAIMFIHNSTAKPLMTMEGVFLSPGYETDIAISQINYQRLGQPFSDCVADTTAFQDSSSVLYNIALNQTKQYKQKYCLQVCVIYFYNNSSELI